MELETGRVLPQIISREELDEIPIETAIKIDKYFVQHFEYLVKAQELYEFAEQTWRKLNLIFYFFFLSFANFIASNYFIHVFLIFVN